MASASNAFQTYLAYKFVRDLTTPWNKTSAFKLGIIDGKGQILIPQVAFSLPDQRAAATMWDRLVWNVKRSLEKLPGGKSSLARYGTAMWLLRENAEAVDNIISETITNSLGSSDLPIPDVPIFKKKKKRSPKMKDSKTLEHIVAEGKVLKVVVRGGKRKRIVKCTGDNQKVQNGKCVTKTGKDKVRLRKAAKKRGRTMKGKSKSMAIKKMLKSRRKAH